MSEDDADASLVETAESRSRRRGTEKPLSETERVQLRETAVKDWEEEGYQVQGKEAKDDRGWIGAY